MNECHASLEMIGVRWSVFAGFSHGAKRCRRQSTSVYFTKPLAYYSTSQETSSAGPSGAKKHQKRTSAWSTNNVVFPSRALPDEIMLRETPFAFFAVGRFQRRGFKMTCAVMPFIPYTILLKIFTCDGSPGPTGATFGGL